MKVLAPLCSEPLGAKNSSSDYIRRICLGHLGSRHVQLGYSPHFETPAETDNKPPG